MKYFINQNGKSKDLTGMVQATASVSALIEAREDKRRAKRIAQRRARRITRLNRK